MIKKLGGGMRHLWLKKTWMACLATGLLCSLFAAGCAERGGGNATILGNEAPPKKQAVAPPPPKCFSNLKIAPQKESGGVVVEPIVFSDYNTNRHYVYNVVEQTEGGKTSNSNELSWSVNALRFKVKTDKAGKYRFGYAVNKDSIAVYSRRGKAEVEAYGKLKGTVSANSLFGSYYEPATRKHFVALSTQEDKVVEVYSTGGEGGRGFSFVGQYRLPPDVFANTPITLLPGGVCVFLDTRGTINLFDPKGKSPARASLRTVVNPDIYSSRTPLGSASGGAWKHVIIPEFQGTRLFFQIVSFNQQAGVSGVKYTRIEAPTQGGTTVGWPVIKQLEPGRCHITFLTADPQNQRRMFLNLVVYDCSASSGRASWQAVESWRKELPANSRISADKDIFIGYLPMPGSIRKEQTDLYAFVAGEDLTVVHFYRNGAGQPAQRIVGQLRDLGQAYAEPVILGPQQIFIIQKNQVTHVSTKVGSVELDGEIANPAITALFREPLTAHMSLKEIQAVARGYLYVKRTDGHTARINISARPTSYELHRSITGRVLLAARGEKLVFLQMAENELHVARGGVILGQISLPGGARPAKNAALSPDGRLLLAADARGGVHCFDLAGDKIKRLWSKGGLGAGGARGKSLAIDRNRAYILSRGKVLFIVKDPLAQANKTGGAVNTGRVHLRTAMQSIALLGSNRLALLSKAQEIYLAEFRRNSVRLRRQFALWGVRRILENDGQVLAWRKKSVVMLGQKDCRPRAIPDNTTSLFWDSCGELWSLDVQKVIRTLGRMKCK